jgi:threonine synthase
VVGSLIFGPRLVAVEGNYDEVNRLCAEVATRTRWAFVNINIRPYYAEGSKTYGFEVAEQFGWKAPRHIVVPVASGSLLVKIWKGLKELHKLGLIEKPHTRVYAAQAEGCAPIVTLVQEDSKILKPVKPKTIAKSLAIGNPADGYYAADAIRESEGWATAVSDEEIVRAMKLLGETEGIFTETAGGVTLAATQRLIEEKRIPRDESIVVSITGHGLKTQEAVMDHIGKPIRIKPTLASFEELVGS